jgi:hypothetical protein
VSEEFCAFGCYGVLPMATGQGLRERFKGRKALVSGRTYQITREGSKDRANGMKRKVARSSSEARRASVL